MPYNKVLIGRLEWLTLREKHLIARLWGTDCRVPSTYEEVAEKYGITPARVRQIERKAFRKIQNPRYLEKRSAFLD